MKRSLLTICVFLLASPYTAGADNIIFQDGSKSPVTQPDNATALANTSTTYSNIHFFDQDIERIDLDLQSRDKTFVIPLLESVAEAATTPNEEVISDFMRMNKGVHEAESTEDIKPFLTQEYFQKMTGQEGLSDKEKMRLVKGFRPQHIEIIDSRIGEDTARLIARSDHYILGTVYGVIDLVRIENSWKIMNETWFVGGLGKLKTQAPIADEFAFNAEQVFHEYDKTDNEYNFETDSYKIEDYNPLGLQKFNIKRNKRVVALTFVAVKSEKSRMARLLDEEDNPQKETKKHMHIMWTGPKELLPEPKEYKTDYPLDISIANKKAGYKPGEVNMVLPSKKPKGVMVSMFYNF
ncbi:MAG: hypothetical protein KC618_00655 [Candidatus Omnitrophica bacterium]|nr:hypothetical protein [Candidatus Omnitrophota bacterium]